MLKQITATAALLLGAVACAWGDSIQFKDGRFFDVPKIVQEGEDYKIVYDHGEVLVKKDLVNAVLMLDASGSYVPKNDEEKAQVDKGLVPWDGKWIAKADRDKKIKEKNDKARKEMEEVKKHQEWRDRYKAESKHFKFEYTIPQAKFEEYRELMEVYYETFMAKWKIKVPAKQPKLLVCYYHDEDSFHQVGGAPQGVIGYFRFVDPIELNFFYERNDERLTLDVMFHETNHYLTFLINPKFNYPPWVNESLAEYYGASEWDPVKKKMSVGHIQEGRLVVLQDAIAGEEWQGLEDMIRLPDFAALHYAWGWSFVHYLMEGAGKKYAAAFQAFYTDLGLNKDFKRVERGQFTQCEPDEVIKQLKKYLKVNDLKVLEKEWHDYVKNDLKLKTYRGYEEAAQWAMGWGLTIKAGRYYQKAVDEGTKNPLTFYHYGNWLRAKDRADEALKMLDRSAELDPMNPYLYLAYGDCWESKDDKEKAEKLKKLALEIDPNDPWLAFRARGVRVVGK